MLHPPAHCPCRSFTLHLATERLLCPAWLPVLPVLPSFAAFVHHMSGCKSYTALQALSLSFTFAMLYNGCPACAAGSEIAGEAAAGLAAAYVVLGANKAVSASTLSSYLTHAEQLYTLATTHQGSYQTLTDDPCLKQLGVRACARLNAYPKPKPRSFMTPDCLDLLADWTLSAMLFANCGLLTTRSARYTPS